MAAKRRGTSRDAPRRPDRDHDAADAGAHAGDLDHPDRVLQRLRSGGKRLRRQLRPSGPEYHRPQQLRGVARGEVARPPASDRAGHHQGRHDVQIPRPRPGLQSSISIRFGGRAGAARRYWRNKLLVQMLSRNPLVLSSTMGFPLHSRAGESPSSAPPQRLHWLATCAPCPDARRSRGFIYCWPVPHRERHGVRRVWRSGLRRPARPARPR